MEKIKEEPKKVKTNEERIEELKQQLELSKAQYHRLEGAIAILEQTISEDK